MEIWTLAVQARVETGAKQVVSQGLSAEAYIGLIAGILAAAAAFVLLMFAPNVLEKFPYLLPVVIGVIAFPTLLFTVIYMAKVANGMGLGSPRHAFGLPPGTMRGVLALGFMILVLIFGAFTITTVSTTNSGKRVDTITVPSDKSPSEYLREIRENHPVYYVFDPVPGDDDKGGTIGVFDPTQGNAVVQISQQVLTMLATALTAIVGFYFGSRTASEPESPKITEQSPNDWSKLEIIFAQATSLNEKFKEKSGLFEQFQPGPPEKTDIRKANFLAWKEIFSLGITELFRIHGEASAYREEPTKVSEYLESVERLWKKINEAWSVVSSVTAASADEDILKTLDSGP